MGIVGQIKSLGFSYVFERVFERIVPAWMFRFSSLAVYQIESSKFSDGPFSNAVVKICDSAQEFEGLRDVTSADGEEAQTIGFVAKMDSEVAGGCLLYTSDAADE